MTDNILLIGLILVFFLGSYIFWKWWNTSTTPPGQFPIDQVNPPTWSVTNKIYRYKPSSVTTG